MHTYQIRDNQVPRFTFIKYNSHYSFVVIKYNLIESSINIHLVSIVAVSILPSIKVTECAHKEEQSKALFTV